MTGKKTSVGFGQGVRVTQNPPKNEPDRYGEAMEKWNISMHPDLRNLLCRQATWQKEERTGWNVVRYSRDRASGQLKIESHEEHAKGSEVVAFGPGIKVMTDSTWEHPDKEHWEIYVSDQLEPLFRHPQVKQGDDKGWKSEVDTGWKVRGYFRTKQAKYRAAAADVKCH